MQNSHKSFIAKIQKLCKLILPKAVPTSGHRFWETPPLMFCRFRTNPVRASCPAAVGSYSGVRNKNKPADVLVEPLLETLRFATKNEACTIVQVTVDVDGQHESFHAHRRDAESFLTSELFETRHVFSNTVTGEWSRSCLYKMF